MTHKDIYTKFMIEYDKANVTSSYPSLTEYEVATILDKAYNALIAQKVTGNNVRRAGFESDVKAIADLSPLVTTENFRFVDNWERFNVRKAELPEHLLYYIDSSLLVTHGYHSQRLDGFGNTIQVDTKLIDHNSAKKFIASDYNMPWIKTPVCYIEDGFIFFIMDPLLLSNADNLQEGFGNRFNGRGFITYIKKPNQFAKDIYDDRFEGMQNVTYFKEPDNASDDIKKLYTFECNDTVAEELISLAVAFALENVESSRLNAKLNMRGLEA